MNHSAAIGARRRAHAACGVACRTLSAACCCSGPNAVHVLSRVLQRSLWLEMRVSGGACLLACMRVPQVMVFFVVIIHWIASLQYWVGISEEYR